jgi:hypothetical protein
MGWKVVERFQRFFRLRRERSSFQDSWCCLLCYDTHMQPGMETCLCCQGGTETLAVCSSKTLVLTYQTTRTHYLDHKLSTQMATRNAILWDVTPWSLVQFHPTSPVLLAAYFLLVTGLTYSSTLKTEAVGYSSRIWGPTFSKPAITANARSGCHPPPAQLLFPRAVWSWAINFRPFLRVWKLRVLALSSQMR